MTLLKVKGHRAVQISKVKGHATDEMVADGKVRKEDKEGNDEADAAAKEGMMLHGKETVQLGRILTARHVIYTRLVNDPRPHDQGTQ